MAARRLPRRVSGARDLLPRRQATTRHDVDAGLATDDRPDRSTSRHHRRSRGLRYHGETTMSRSRSFATASVALAIASFVACSDPGSTGVQSTAAALDRAGFDQAGAHRQYGAPQKVGNGTVRTYIVMDQKNGGRPLEVGVSLSEQA